MKLSGIFLAAATPFDSRGELYRAKIHYNVCKWNLTPVSGYVVGSTAGEGPSLESGELFRLWEEVAAAAPDKLRIAGVRQESVRLAVVLGRKAAELGYQALYVEPPSAYPGESQRSSTQKLFFRAVADQVPLPVIVANDGSLSVETIAALAEHPNIIAASQPGPAGSITALRLVLPKAFGLLAGSVSTLASALQAGASAAVLPFANAAPYVCYSIEEAVRTREYGAAEELQARVSGAAEAVERHGIAGLKCAMDWMGYYGGPVRLPLPPLDSSARQEIQQAFAAIRS